MVHIITTAHKIFTKNIGS